MSDLPPLAYTRADSLEETFVALARAGTRIYAGGTDLLVALNTRAPWVSSAAELVDIKGLSDAMGIVDLGTRIRVGALETAHELIESELIGSSAAVLAEAAARTSSPTLRRRGTVGGNLITPHPAGDVLTALLALDATIEIATSASTRRTLAIGDLYSPDGTLTAGPAVVLSVSYEKCADSAFEKRGVRTSFSRSIGAVAVVRRRDLFRVALGGAGPRPFVASRTASALDEGTGLEAALRRDLEDSHALPGDDVLRLLQALIEVAAERASGGRAITSK